MMSLRSLLAFAAAINIVITIFVITCIFLALRFEPELAIRQLDHGGLGITVLLVIYYHSNTVKRTEHLKNYAWYHRITLLILSSISGAIALIALQMTLNSLGYQYQAPEVDGTAYTYAINALWFFLMVAIIELSTRLTQPRSVQVEAK